MNTEELKEALQIFYDSADDLGIAVYAILKNKNDMAPRKIDIADDALGDLKRFFLLSLRENISNKADLTVLKLSTSDERLDAIYVYDLECPEELSTLEAVVKDDNFPLMNFDDEELSDIKSILIEIGNNDKQIVLYKTMSPINIFGRSGFFLKKDRHRMKKIDDEFLRVSANFQLLRINEELLVMDLTAIERNFGFHEIITREAIAGINSIADIGLVENPLVLSELVDDIKYARRFTKVAKSSPVIQAQVTNENIIKFCENYPLLKGRIRFNANKDKIVLDTKVSKDLFIKLMMDDFLTSELTSYHYQSIAKDKAEAS
ncbi:MAG: anti-phage protein KwaB [Paenalcaligenes sp.]